MARQDPGAAAGDSAIEIKTNDGFVKCVASDIVPKRFGLHLQRRHIFLEYAVPRHGLLAVHPIEVDFGGATGSTSPAGGGGDAVDSSLAKQLLEEHKLWLGAVSVEQLAALVARLRAGARGGGGPPSKRPRRSRIKGIPETARASARSKEPEIRKAFDVARAGSSAETLSLEDVLGFMADYLGFSLAEAQLFFDTHGANGAGVTFEAFTCGYPRLNPFMVSKLAGKDARSNEVIVRKAGGLGGLQGSVQQISLEYLEDSEAYVCTSTAQAFVDDCKRSVMMFAPCQSSVFVRNCEDCVLFIAAQQLRTRDCKRCTFYLYSKTEPVIESSEDLSFAPWTASFPGCSELFEKAQFDPKRNLWNAIFDFTGTPDRANWRILPLNEVRTLRVELPEEKFTGVVEGGKGLEPDNPVPQVTHEVLCADPLASEDTGQSMGNIPQTRPSLPPAPSGPVKVPGFLFRDDGPPRRKVGVSWFGGASQ